MPGVTLAGLAAKFTIAGRAPTVTVTGAVTVPKLLVAVRMYDAVDAGVTFSEDPVTAPIPGLRVSVGEPVTTHVSVLDCPRGIVAGAAVKLVIFGGLPTLTVSDAVAVPNAFVAVSV